MANTSYKPSRLHKTHSSKEIKYHLDEDDDELGDKMTSQVHDLRRQGSMLSNASSGSGPPAPRECTWMDRLSATGDQLETDGPEVEIQAPVKTAWGARDRGMVSDDDDDAESKGVLGNANGDKRRYKTDQRAHRKHRSSATTSREGFSNLSFQNDDKTDHLTELRQFRARFNSCVKNAQKNRRQWVTIRKEVKSNCEMICSEIESRKRDLHALIDSYADSLIQQVTALTKARIAKTSSVVESTKSALREIKALDETYLTDECQLSDGDLMKAKESIENVCVKLSTQNVETARWEPISINRCENSAGLVHTLVGELTGMSSESLITGNLNNDELQAQIGNLLKVPEPKKNFMCKSNKDSRECGITDVAISANDDIVVVDKHNRLVKVYTIGGLFQRFIGRKQIREPCRVSVLSARDHVLVTDMGSKSVPIFQLDGTYVGEFASDLKFPLSPQEMYNGNIAILEYATKSVIMFSSSLKQVGVFPTGMDFPGYMICTKNDNIAISDSKKNLVKIFDVSGNTIKLIEGPGDGPGMVLGPQGLAADRYGRILVTEKGNHRVQIFTENGDHIQCYERDADNFKLPWALTCNRHDLLVVAGYQGTIRVMRYMEIHLDGTRHEVEGRPTLSKAARRQKQRQQDNQF